MKGVCRPGKALHMHARLMLPRWVCRGCHSSGLSHLPSQSAALHAVLLRFEESLLAPPCRLPGLELPRASLLC
jgi:hypothetical protein